MITRDQLADAILRECDITLHLYGKLVPGAMTYRPSPEQRSTLDLLRYLSICGIAGLTCMAEADWRRFAAFAERSEGMGEEGFPAAMTRQREEIAAFFAGVSEEALASRLAPMPGGGKLPLGAAILNGPLKWMTAYKMQLFLYAKASGATGIGTANAWAGTDPKA